VDLAISSLQEFLSDEKKMEWRNGIPIIAILGMDTSTEEAPNALKTNNDEFENTIKKFLNFCTYVTDTR
jgi:hypothetical protein